MINALSQESINIFSSDPAGVKERPTNGYYASGVDVGYTAPAKWWNWLWNKLTTFFTASRADRESVLNEIKSVLSSASIAVDPTDNTQLSKATKVVCYQREEAYDNETITEEIGGVTVTHPKNRPYVVGYTVYYPNTELL